MKKPEKKITFLTRLRNKYRLVVINDETFEEKVSLKLSRLNVFLVMSTVAILLIGSTILLIAFTPLREYIPGYSSTALRRTSIQLVHKTDSLERALATERLYIDNLRNVINGTPIDPTAAQRDSVAIATGEDMAPSAADSSMRQLVEAEERFNVNSNNGSNLLNISFIPPVQGLISSAFNKSENHFGVDVTAKKNTPIKSCMSGTIVFSDWTTDAGYVVIIQHEEALISTYKHCSAVLKKLGDYVQAGEAIAIIGNSGKHTSGPHLHFELWHRGIAVNPESYIAF